MTRGVALILTLYTVVPFAIIVLYSLSVFLIRKWHIEHFSPRLPALHKRPWAVNPFRAPARAGRVRMQQDLDRLAARWKGPVHRSLAVAAQRIAPSDGDFKQAPAVVVYRNLAFVALPVALSAAYGAISASLPILAYGGTLNFLAPRIDWSVVESTIACALLGGFVGAMVGHSVGANLFKFPRTEVLRKLRHSGHGLDAKSMYSASVHFAANRFYFLYSFVGFFVPLLYLMFIAEGVVSNSDSRAAQSETSPLGQFVADWFLAIVFTSVLVASFGIRRTSARMKALGTILTYLYRYDRTYPDSPIRQAEPRIEDRQRIRLARLADRLDYYSRSIGRPLSRRSTVHPTALIMRAAARNIRTLLRSRDSLHAKGFDGTSQTLRGVAACLADSTELDVLALADGVAAYGEDGTPAEDLIEPNPGRLSRLARRLSAALGGDFERPIKAVQNVAMIVGILIALYAFLARGDLSALKDAIPK